jgi:hypothetical protein
VTKAKSIFLLHRDSNSSETIEEKLSFKKNSLQVLLQKPNYLEK